MTQPPFLLSDIGRYAYRLSRREALLALCDVVGSAQFLTAWMEHDGCPDPFCRYGKPHGSTDPETMWHDPDCPFLSLLEALAKFTVEQETP